MKLSKIQKIRVEGNVEKREPFCSVGRLTNYEGTPSPSLKAELLYDPAILILGIYPKDMKSASQGNICSPVIIAALFTIAGVILK